jgi:MFS family permease
MDDDPAPAAAPIELRPPRLLDQRDFLLFWFSRWTASLAVMIEAVTLQWQVYDLARSQAHLDVKHAAFMVSLLGLVTFLPVVALTLPAGETADRHERKRIMAICEAGEILTIALLAAAALFHFASLPMLLAVAVVFGVLRSFFSPASTALAPMLVPRELLPRAIAWNSLAWQTAAIGGPALGGLLIAVSPATAYLVGLGLYLVAVIAILCLKTSTKPKVQPGSRWTLMKEGLAYVWSNKIVFGSISLDLFAVLLGGATGLLGVFARVVLHVGPQGFGLLRAGAAMGAAPVALYLANRPLQRHAGKVMFIAVAVFGAGTVVFGLSTSLALSVTMLALLGGADMLSVYIRQTLVQIVTPDHMRGRVGAVSSLFIGASNELGEFESGLAARFLGPVGAAVFGGIGAMVVTGAWAAMFPALRKADRLIALEASSAPVETPLPAAASAP